MHVYIRHVLWSSKIIGSTGIKYQIDKNTITNETYNNKDNMPFLFATITSNDQVSNKKKEAWASKN